MLKNSPQPVIILAAARSGSKLLRDILASSAQVDVVPYDINYIWKHANQHIFHDELNEQDLDEKSRGYIRERILSFAGDSQADYVVEKTVSNSLRVGFVRSVFPEAKLIHLYRDGRDVALSALSCWTSNVVDSRNQPFTTYLQKLISFPYFSASGYLFQRCKELICQTFSSNNHYLWGPRFAGIKEVVSAKPIAHVCAHQWVNSVESTLTQLEKLTVNSDYVPIKYEALIENPEHEIRNLCGFIGITDTQAVVDYARRTISTDSKGRWNKQFEKFENDLLPIMQPSLVRLGYLSTLNEQGV